MMRMHRSHLLALACLLSGCLPWGDASDWADAPAGVVSWEWILQSDALPDAPPAVQHMGFDGLEADAAYVQAVMDAGAEPWCYLSVGTAEEAREDFAEFEARDQAARDAGEDPILGEPLPGWPDERILNLGRYEDFVDLMRARLQVCADKGFVRVEFDNMDTWTFDVQPSFSQEQTADYVEALVSEAAGLGMGVIHKNAPDLIPELEPIMDALLFESCVLWDECDTAAPFVASGKPVFDAEYPDGPWGEQGKSATVEQMCAGADVSVLIKKRDLDDSTIVCAAR